MEDEKEDPTVIQYALNLLAACHSESLLFEVATKLAEAFSGNDPVLEFLSDKTVERLEELRRTVPADAIPPRKLKFADA